jgi:hypothetical protein
MRGCESAPNRRSPLPLSVGTYKALLFLWALCVLLCFCANSRFSSYNLRGCLCPLPSVCVNSASRVLTLSFVYQLEIYVKTEWKRACNCVMCSLIFTFPTSWLLLSTLLYNFGLPSCQYEESMEEIAYIAGFGNRIDNHDISTVKTNPVLWL